MSAKSSVFINLTIIANSTVNLVFNQDPLQGKTRQICANCTKIPYREKAGNLNNPSNIWEKSGNSREKLGKLFFRTYKATDKQNTKNLNYLYFSYNFVSVFIRLFVYCRVPTPTGGPNQCAGTASKSGKGRKSWAKGGRDSALSPQSSVESTESSEELCMWLQLW